MHCAATHEQITQLVDAKQAEVLERMRELQRFAEQLDEVRIALQETPPPTACLPDLSCCVPTSQDASVIAIDGLPTRRARTASTSPT